MDPHRSARGEQQGRLRREMGHRPAEPLRARARRHAAEGAGGRLSSTPGRRSSLAFARAVLLAATLVTAATPAVGQAYRSPLSAFAAPGPRLEHATPDPRWQGIVFPARKSRRYRRAPDRGGLETRRQACEPYFAEAAQLYKLPVDFLRAVAHVESGFYASALSVDGAMGVMQLMPFTARKMGVTRPDDARQNIFGGARFLRILANQWAGDIVLTVASYNAGAGAVKKYGGVPPYAETQRYVRRVLARFQAYALERKQTQHAAATTVTSAVGSDGSFSSTTHDSHVPRGKQHVPTSDANAPRPANVATLPVGSRVRRETGDHSS